ncbi:MAG: SufE family protein [Gammaproteobacteria bacterium]|nr:SufE family protein [Gammaproteobacteria bacterium]MYJ75441.1 SufE family protein [Gammaproteobacteria bacterium]
MAAEAASALDDIRSTFGFFDAWQDKYAYLIDIGKELSPFPDAHRTEDNLVRGCQSQVWLLPRFDGNRLHLTIDSDAHIVRGLIAIVLAAFDGRSPRQILDFDIEGLFDELDLIGHLSATRGNGLRAMVGKIQSIAQEHVGA